MPPKKNIKMDLNSFLADDAFGSNDSNSWADDFNPDMLKSSSTVGIDIDLGLDEEPIPENPPYTARISSLPIDCQAIDIEDFFMKGLNLDGNAFDQVVEDFFVPRDLQMKPYAFITFNSRDLLVEALNLNNHLINNKQVYVSVAKPSKNPRQPRTGGPRERRPQFDVDWSGARGGAANLPVREDRPFMRESHPPRERRQEANVDWSGARGSAANLPVREDRPFIRESHPPRERRQEANVDWSGARGSAANLPVREDKPFIRTNSQPNRERKSAPDVDWNAARGSQAPVLKKESESRSASTKFTPRKVKEDDIDFGAARRAAAQIPVKTTTATSTSTANSASNNSEKKEKPTNDGPKKSIYSVLAGESDEEEAQEREQESIEKVTEAASKLDLADEDGWEKV